MQSPNDIEARVTNLEIKSSFADDLLDSLNQTVFRQQQRIDLLIEELRTLRDQTAHADGPRQLRDDLPPHY